MAEPAFEGQRPPFEPGNDLAVRHGGFSLLNLDDRVAEIAAELHERMAGYQSPRFEPAVQAAAIAGARLERVFGALADLPEEDVSQRLEAEASRWWSRWVKALDALGLTPLSASKLRLNVAIAGRVGVPSLRERAEAERDAGS